MSRPRPTQRPVEEARVRPLYARVLRLRHFEPSAMVCFILLEGSVAAALVLALAELLSWWGLIVLPVAVALLVKANDLVAGIMARDADQVPQRERERFQRELRPAVGRATVPVSPTPNGGHPPRAADRPGTVYASSGRFDQPGHGGSDRSGWQSQSPEWRGQSPEWHGQQPEWHGQQPEWRGEQREWRGEQREWRGEQPDWRGQLPEWRGDQRGWRSGQPGRQSAERRYG
ncbi:MAG TPA: hypothetical protein VHN18_05830 [Micromonosporaceae bacterium]|nr:hypothetical protein [Micromonosporaceae bacterium]